MKRVCNDPYSDLYIDQKIAVEPIKEIFWHGQVKLPQINQYSA